MSDLEMSPSEQDMVYDSQQENARKERIEQFGFDVLDQSLWKTFNSKKQVKSVPMTRGIYNKYQGWETPENENPEDVGYLIEYLDGGKPNHPDHEGYISWSPKDVFDRNHSPVSERGLTPSLQILDESPFIPLSIKRHRIHIELDPSDPAGEEYVARLKSLIKEAGGTGPRGLIAGLPMMDEASFYPNGVPMTIYKSKPLGNGMALGTVETLSGENGKLDFSDALRALKFGYRVQRSGWNGKDMWLSVSNLNTATVPADKFWSPHNSEYAKNNGGSAEVPPCITMKNAKGQIQMGWAPSPEDMFCSDWFVFEKQDEFSGTDDIATMTDEADFPANLADVKRERIAPSFTFTERHYKPHFYEIGKRLPYNFTGEDLLELLKEAFPAELKDQLYYAPGKTCYSIGLTGHDRILFIKDVDADTIRFNGDSDKEALTHTKQPEFMDTLFMKFFELLFPVGTNPLTIQKHGKSAFDFDRTDFGKVLVRLDNFFNNDARAVHGEHREGMYRTQLELMILLENLLNCHGADIGENGEVMTGLSLPEALMFVDAGLSVRHKTWGPEDSIFKVSREGGTTIYRAGEDLPWVVPSEEVFRENWVLLYK